MSLLQMRCPHKREAEEPTWRTIMFVLSLLFLALLASSSGQSGVPQYENDEWIISDESPHYEDLKSLSVEESLWPDIPAGVADAMVVEDTGLLTSPETHVMEEREPDKEESALWKIILVVAVLLVSTVGSVGMAYYLCVWRGGRIHYKPHKEVYA